LAKGSFSPALIWDARVTGAVVKSCRLMITVATATMLMAMTI